jgi:hypothetical protein
MPPLYFLDSNVLIEASNRYYSFDIAPGFWTSIEGHASAGTISSPQSVLVEIEENEDDLTSWAKGQGSILFVISGKDEQKAVGEISEYVLKTYSKSEANAFLAKADPWVIAHALVGKGTVVTQEKHVPPNSQKAKIPNVCDHFNVPWIDTFKLLRDLNVQLK